jgi:hypothetical protein
MNRIRLVGIKTKLSTCTTWIGIKEIYPFTVKPQNSIQRTARQYAGAVGYTSIQRSIEPK